MSVAFHDIHHSYDDVPILKGVSLSAAAGEVLCLLGPSGSGKTTLLRLAAGLEPLQRGRIAIDEQTVADTSQHCPPEQRGVGLVFQEHVLYPHLSVAANVGFGLAKLPPSERQERVTEQLASVDLRDFAHRYPHTLSGGQQQRVALARALAPRPRVLLMDEPFASVDSNLRRRLQAQTRLLLKQQGTTTVVVTHDAEEALALADQVAYLEDGRVLQAGTPRSLWEQPTHCVVATTLLGGTPFPVTLDGNQVRSAYGVLPREAFLDLRDAAATGGAAIALLRPGTVRLAATSKRTLTLVDARFAGSGEQVVLKSEVDAAAEPLTLSLADVTVPAVGTCVHLELEANAGLLYDADANIPQGQPTLS